MLSSQDKVLDGHVTVRFTTRWPYNIISLAIGFLTGSPHRFSHVMAIIDGKVYEATMMHGCRVCSLEDAMDGVKRFQDMVVYVPDIEAATAFGEAQHGKGYDWGGALGLPLLCSEEWSDDTKWWCSEHVFALLMAGGTTLLDPDEKTRVTPNDLHQCYYPKSAVFRSEYFEQKTPAVK